jgi:hypothetical protein
MKMVEMCRAQNGGDGCDKSRWERGFAESLRGREYCPPGTTLDSTSGYCTSGDEAYGPFTRELVARCKETSDPNVCEKMRWSKLFVAETRGLAAR